MQEVKGWSCSFQQWHPRRLGCDCLSNSCSVDCEEEWWHHTPLSESNTNGEQLRFNSSTRTQTSEQEYCSATDGTKTASGILHLWFNYLGASFFTAFGIYCAREAKEGDVPVVSAFTPVSDLVHEDDHPSLPIFWSSSRTPWHLTHTSQQRTPVQGFEHFRSESAFGVFTARKTSAAVLVFSSPTQMYLLCVWQCDSNWI